MPTFGWPAAFSAPRPGVPDIDEAVAILASMGAMADGGEVRRGEAAWMTPQLMSDGGKPWPSVEVSATLKAVSDKAVATLYEGVAAGHLMAHMHLADLLHYGKGVAKEEETAFELYTVVASQMETQVGDGEGEGALRQ